jgi:WD40 repeat protein
MGENGMNLWNHSGRLLASVLLLGAIGGIVAQGETKSDPAILKLIDQLGDEKPDARTAAEKELIEKGLPVLESLNEAIQSHPDPDVKLRAILLVSTIRKGAYGQLRKFAGHKGGGIRHIAVSKDGKRALTGSMDTTVRLWDLESGKELKTLEGHSSWTWQVAFSPDEKQAFSSGGVDGTIRRWDLETGKELMKYTGHKNWVYGIAITPDGKFLFASGAGKKDGEEQGDSTIRQFDVETGKEIQQLEGHTGYVWKLAISPDGKYLASAGGNDNTMKIWNVSTGKLVHDLVDAHNGNFIVGVAFSPDSKFLLSAGRDGFARLWDLATGKELAVYEGFSENPEAVAWSPDGKRFLASDSNKVHVFDRESGKVVHRFEEHTGKVFAVKFLPDGQRALSGGVDNILRMWGVPK